MTEETHPQGLEMRTPTTRRSFLAGSAAALAGGAPMAIPGVAQAHKPGNPPTDIKEYRVKRYRVLEFYGTSSAGTVG
jgi:hypothetical protein